MLKKSESFRITRETGWARVSLAVAKNVLLSLSLHFLMQDPKRIESGALGPITEKGALSVCAVPPPSFLAWF